MFEDFNPKVSCIEERRLGGTGNRRRAGLCPARVAH